MKALLSTTAAVAYASQPVGADLYTVQAGQAAVARAGRRGQGPEAVVGDPFETRSPDSGYMLPYWDKVDTILDGIEGMRLAGEWYLPKFTDEQTHDFNFRLSCTKMTNVYRDIVEGLANKPFEQDIKLIETAGEGNDMPVPQQIKDFQWDVDGSNNSLSVFGSALFFNGINAAIDWIYVDYPKRASNVVTLADARQAGIRPYWSHVLGRNVLDVRSEVINGRETLTYMKIMEPGTPDHIREFKRDDTTGAVTWTLYEKRASKQAGSDTAYVQIENGDISIGRIPLVPFTTGRRVGRSWKFMPAMQDAAELQIELYQQESGLKFAKVLTAYPMLAANGITPPKGADGKAVTKIAVGPNRVLWSNADTTNGKIGHWSYVEPNAESLKFLAADIADTIQQLRELGRQPLTAQSGNITVITAAVAAGKARSAVKAWALKLKDTLESALELTAEWYGIKDYNPVVHVYIEFDDYIENEDLDTLNKARESGDLSRETYYEELQRRGVLSSNFTYDRENTRLLGELPSDTNVPLTGG